MINPVSISVIIATRNREQLLWETVTKACLVLENKNAEIIIINDSDTPLTLPVWLENKVRYFDNPQRGVSAARNFGVQHARGETLFFIDDDMWINTGVIDWIREFVIEKKNTKPVYYINWVYPPVLDDTLKRSKVGRYILAARYNTLWGRMLKKTEQPLSGLYKYDHLGSCSLVIAKEVFSSVGCYNEAIVFAGEDADLANRLHALGIPIYVVFDITLFHNHQDRLEIYSFLKRIYDGAGSEFKAILAGADIPFKNTKYKGLKLFVFEFFRITEKGWIMLHKILPNSAILQAQQNKLIGMLGGLQKYKQWRNVIYRSGRNSGVNK